MSDAIPEEFMKAAIVVLTRLETPLFYQGNSVEFRKSEDFDCETIARALMAAAKEADEAATKRERERDKWQPIETAPKGVVTDAAWVKPHYILVMSASGAHVCYWDWYYAENGDGHRKGMSGWVELCSGEQIALHIGEPTHWMPLPPPPATLKGEA